MALIEEHNPTADQSSGIRSYHQFKNASRELFTSKDLLPSIKRAVQDNPEYVHRLIGDLRPIKSRKLGGLNVQIGQEDHQLTEADVSELYTLIALFTEHRNWNIITSNLLNLMDDHRLEYKLMACELLGSLLDVFDIHKTGLVSLFQDNLKIYVTFYNDNGEVVEQLINKAVDLLMRLDDSLESSIDLLNTILVSLDKKFSRNDESSSHLLILIRKVDQMVGILGCKILISFNRINFLFNQMLTNPYLNESKSEVIPELLQIQTKVLTIFHSADEHGKRLIYEYRFDLLACWTVVERRCGADSSKPRAALQVIAKDLGETLEHISN